MLRDRLAEGHALGNGRTHVVGGQVVHQVVLHQQGGDRETADQVAGQGQRGMVEQVLHLAPGVEVGEVVAGEAPHGEPLESHREIQQQQ